MEPVLAGEILCDECVTEGAAFRMAGPGLGAMERELGDLRSLTRPATRDAASAGSSCSHTRTTCQPARRNRSSVSASRRRLPMILSFQNPAVAPLAGR